jgi:hypothetical protein
MWTSRRLSVSSYVSVLACVYSRVCEYTSVFVCVRVFLGVCECDCRCMCV